MMYKNGELENVNILKLLFAILLKYLIFALVFTDGGIA